MTQIPNLLTELGLNKYESKIYTTLIEEGIATAKNISDITGVPYGKVYEIVNSLSSKGFLTILPTKPLRCQAVAPKEVVANIKKINDDKFRKIEKNMISALEPLFMQNKKSEEPKNVFWIVNGRSNINKKVESLITNSGKYFNIITTENGLKKLVFHKDLLRKAKENGIDINLACKITRENLEDFNSLSEICNIRHSNRVHNSYFSNGSSSMIIEPLPDDENFMHGRDFGIWVSGDSFTKFLDELFNAHFANSLESEERIKKLRK